MKTYPPTPKDYLITILHNKGDCSYFTNNKYNCNYCPIVKPCGEIRKNNQFIIDRQERKVKLAKKALKEIEQMEKKLEWLEGLK